MVEDNIKPVIVAVSGYFDPLHVGHLEYFGKAKSLGDFLVVIVNNDEQLKKNRNVSKPFMKQEDRINLIETINFVDKVVLSIDKDGSVNETLKLLKPDIFAKGGGVEFGENVPETETCKELGIKMVYGLGSKIRRFATTSSEIEEYASKETKIKEYRAE
jgi:D-beta-D-heptose 7-phosphate kinase/D-beta-D-heptose 1-phosphate adenosyltransferase